MGIILGAILAISVYGGMNFYVGKRLYQYINFFFPKANGIVFIVFIVFYILLVSTMFISVMPLPINIKNITRLISAYWLGVFVYLFVFFLLPDIIILSGRLVKLIPAHSLQSVRFYAGTIAILLTIGVVGYGLYNANQLKIVSYDIQLNRSLSEKMNIVLIADLHLGDVNSKRRLESIVQGINSLTPDIVCIAGDIFNDDFYTIRNPGRASALLRNIEARYGVFACLGNHDGNSAGTLNEMIAFLEQSSIKLLNDEHIIIDERIILIGRLDSSPIGGFGESLNGVSSVMSRKDFSEIITQIDVDLPIVVMDHNPANIVEYGNKVNLILAGHTHKGQVFPGSLFTRAMFTVDYGHYQKDSDSPHVIVTQGVHTWMMPMRVGTDNEIVSIMVRGSL